MNAPQGRAGADGVANGDGALGAGLHGGAGGEPGGAGGEPGGAGGGGHGGSRQGRDGADGRGGAGSEPPRVVVMGVSGCGKSTVGALLAGVLEVPFLDADSLHPQENVDRMAAGIPLTDEDRSPWLRAVGDALAAAPAGAVVACSALRRSYRDALRASAPDVAFVHLDGPRHVLAQRLAARLDHFMPAALLDSQLATLEPLEPDERGVVLSLEQGPARLAAEAARLVGGPTTHPA